MITKTNGADEDVEAMEMLQNHPLFMDGDMTNTFHAAAIHAFAAISVGLVPTETSGLSHEDEHNGNNDLYCDMEKENNLGNTSVDTRHYATLEKHLSSSRKVTKKRITDRVNRGPYNSGLLSGKLNIPSLKRYRPSASGSAALKPDPSTSSPTSTTTTNNNTQDMMDEIEKNDTDRQMSGRESDPDSAPTSALDAPQSFLKEKVNDAEAVILLRMMEL